MEHENSFLYGPVNALWHSVQHRFAWDIPDHVIMALLVLVISTVLFGIGSRNAVATNMFAVTFLSLAASLRFSRTRLDTRGLLAPQIGIALITSSLEA